jgi:hypothetical protein
MDLMDEVDVPLGPKHTYSVVAVEGGFSMASIGRIGSAVALGLAAMAALVLAADARQSQGGTLKLDAHRTLGTPHVYRNLTLVPVYDKAARPLDAFLTLDEGLKLKQVSVTESKSGGAVNTLYVTNDSAKPLYLMGGEVVLGGQQDRTLGRDTIIPGRTKEMPVTVFCVEHGRWTGRAEFDQSAPTVASAEIRANAQNGEFYAYREAAAAPAGPGAAGQSGPAGSTVLPGPGASAASRAAAGREFVVRAAQSNKLGEAQRQVWQKVAEKSSKLKAQSSTGSYRAALTLSDGDARKSVPAYVAALSTSLGTDPHLVGVVAAINGKVVAADIFGDPVLFRKLWPKLLRSYASDAVEKLPQDGKPPLVATNLQAKGFLVTATDAKSRIENRSDVSSTVRYESSQAVTFSLVPADKAGAAAGGFGGGAIHTGVLGK